VLAVVVPTKLQFPTGILDKHEIVFYKEGLVATTQVVVDRDDRQDKSIIVDGSGIGGTGIVDEKQQMLAHLPLLLKKDATSFLSIGLGSGILIGESAKHSQIERLKVVEIAPSVVAGSAYFSEENGDIHNNPKIDIEINDGVNYLLTTDQRYDIIASDAKTRPEYGSNGVFYSKDYYDLARQRLSSEGIFMQWLPLYLPHTDYASVLKTFIESFPHASLWFVSPGNSYLIGSENPLRVDYAYVNEMLGDARQPFEGLRKYGITSADALLSHYVAGDEMIGQAVADAQVNSLEHPVIEFYSLRDYAVPSVRRRMKNLELIVELRDQMTDSEWLTNISRSEADRLAAAREAEALFITGFRQVMESGPGQYEMIRYYFDEAINKSPKNDDIRYHIMSNLTSLARFALRQNNVKDAERYAREATLISNRAAEASCIYGQLLLARQEIRRATRQFETCVELRPKWVTAREALANLYIKSGKREAAAEQLRVLETLDPGQE
jgi:spermidine synthase